MCTTTCPRCLQPVPSTQLSDYDVFYVGQLDHRSPYGFAGQKRTVQALSHHDAVCQAASYSEHAPEKPTFYLAIGPDSSLYLTQPTAHLFSITQVGRDDQADFTSTTSFHGRYRVEPVNTKDVSVKV